VTKFGHLSMHLHLTYNLYQLWGSNIDGVWILADPLNLTPQHNRYVLVMSEHFSKWLELFPLLDCSNEGASYAFLTWYLIGLGF
jgi:hypothetical protein